MSRLLEALKRLETQTSRAAEDMPVAGPSPGEADHSAAEDPTVRGEGQMMQTLAEAEMTAAELLYEEPPEAPAAESLFEDLPEAPAAESLFEDLLEVPAAELLCEELPEAPPKPDKETTGTLLPPHEDRSAVDVLERTAPQPVPASPPPSVIRVPPLLEMPPAAEPAAAHALPDVYRKMAQYISGQIPADQASALFFTSPQDGAGKSETLLGLAPSLATQHAVKTLVVDANFRQPTLSRRWAQPRPLGLFEILFAMADWHAAVQPAAAAGVDLLPNFGLPENRARASQPRGFGELLQALRQEYPLVIIDGPSLAHAETAVLAATCNGVYLIVRFCHTNRWAVRTAVDVLAQSGSRLWGCIAVGEE